MQLIGASLKQFYIASIISKLVFIHVRLLVNSAAELLVFTT